MTEEYDRFGYTYRLSDIQAAVGREQLRRLPSVIAERRRLAARYAERLRSVPQVIPPHEPEWARSNWQTYCVRLADTLDQRTVMRALLAAGVASKPGVSCAHREPAFSHARDAWTCAAPSGTCDCPPASCRRLRESERARDHNLILPFFNGMTDEDQDSVVAALRRSCDV